jgi:hypothetical protein
MTDVMRLRRGDMVIALEDLDPEGAHVSKGDKGVVFEEAGFHEPGTGPMVRWLDLGTACNVYPGQVELFQLTDCEPEEGARLPSAVHAAIARAEVYLRISGYDVEEGLLRVVNVGPPAPGNLVKITWSTAIRRP